MERFRNDSGNFVAIVRSVNTFEASLSIRRVNGCLASAFDDTRVRRILELSDAALHRPKWYD